MKYKYIVLICFLASAVLGQSFYNPIFSSGADPSCVFYQGFYYYMQTDGTLDVVQAPQIGGPGGLGWSSPSAHAYTPSAPYNVGIEAPEITYLNGMWYIYYSAGTANDSTDTSHRMFCLQASNPMGPYTYMGEVADSSADYWAIDGHVLKTANGALYFVWCGRAHSYNDGISRLYIAPMSNPWTIVSGSRVCISSPTYSWENNINEAPAFLERNGKTFIIYSANCSCGNNYCLGQLVNTDGNVLNPGSWVKDSVPVFQSYSGPDGTVYAPGSCTFTTSPDQTEDWIIYHTAQYSGSGFTREIHAQQFTWNSDGTPNFAHPIPTGDPVAIQSQNVFGDFDWDGLTDYVLFNPSTGNWNVRSSQSGGNVSSFQFGQSGDIPLIGNWTTHVGAETAVFRPSNGTWYVRLQDGSSHSFGWGASGDIPLIGAWSGQMRDEVVFRPSNGAWYIRFGDGSGNATVYWGGGAGNTSDIPLVGNFGGNGMIDQVIWRPSTGEWFVRDGKLGTEIGSFGWGGGPSYTNDIPMIGAWTGQMRDTAIFRPSTGTWYIRFADGGTTSLQFGQAGDQPMIGNIFGNGMIDQIVFRPSTGTWYVRDGRAGGGTVYSFAFGTNQDVLVHE